MKQREGELGAVCHPAAGLSYIYRLVYGEGGYPCVEVTAVDGSGVRRERSGAFPRDGALARAFLALLIRCEVSPYALVEVYDDFLTHHPI